ncbi:MAG: tetraacyldisaccharide 4'-kinase [Thermovirgaceae bacterium]
MHSLLDSYLRFIRGEESSPVWYALAPLSWIVSTGVFLRTACYDHGIRLTLEPSVPVISVGNLTHGGTNKTPFVELLARLLDSAGIRAGVVSRGYGKKGRTASLVRGGDEPDRTAVGDEAALLSRKLPDCPVCVSPERVEGIRRLAAEGVEVAVADDAFQHRKLGRDADIVLVDATCPWGNGYIFPLGMLREKPRALERAHMVVVTKSDQVPQKKREAILKEISLFCEEDRVFTAGLSLKGWARWDGTWQEENIPPDGKPVAFSAVGNPESFQAFLESLDVKPRQHVRFRDHHAYSVRDMEHVLRTCTEKGADCLICTEKDIYNLPEGWKPPVPLFVPVVETVVHEMDRFLESLAGILRPKVVVASNGYGEDAIGVMLAEKLKQRFQGMDVSGFPLVGAGKAYTARRIPVVSPPSDTPSEGVIKYRLRDLLRDLRHGLLRQITIQAAAWKHLRGRIRTVLCVGDVYLLLHTLWGQGVCPVLVATAKTVLHKGHWRLEHALLKRRCRRVWARDAQTRDEMIRRGVDAAYTGNPIMDLARDNKDKKEYFAGGAGFAKILLLPGSRERAYADIKLLLDAAVLLWEWEKASFAMVVAATLDRHRLLESCPEWRFAETGQIIHQNGVLEIPVTEDDVAEVARGAQVVLGLGGTANQICAGLGIPVVSVLEKGKLVQKKLLGESESLVEPSPWSLAAEAREILKTPEKRRLMSKAGRSRMGPSGALDSVVQFAAAELGWDLRTRVWQRLARHWENNKGGR